MKLKYDRQREKRNYGILAKKNTKKGNNPYSKKFGVKSKHKNKICNKDNNYSNIEGNSVMKYKIGDSSIISSFDQRRTSEVISSTIKNSLIPKTKMRKPSRLRVRKQRRKSEANNVRN